MVFFDQFLLVISEGLIFALFSIGVYLSFRWLRFPDLTPDGSFVVGACTFAAAVNAGFTPVSSMILAFVAGALSGIVTGILNRLVRIPPVIAGLLMSIALYSISWKILGKPNQFLDVSQTIVGDFQGPKYNLILLSYLVFAVAFSLIFLNFFAETIWGLRIRAVGENPLIGRQFTKREDWYHVLLLGLSNAIVSMAGALFLQRSFSADINMGVGQTIVGLVGMIIGLMLSGNTRRIWLIILFIALGSILNKAVMFITLELGLPAELFRLTSASVLVILFFVMRTRDLDLMKNIRWN